MLSFQLFSFFKLLISVLRISILLESSNWPSLTIDFLTWHFLSSNYLFFTLINGIKIFTVIIEVWTCLHFLLRHLTWYIRVTNFCRGAQLCGPFPLEVCNIQRQVEETPPPPYFSLFNTNSRLSTALYSLQKWKKQLESKDKGGTNPRPLSWLISLPKQNKKISWFTFNINSKRRPHTALIPVTFKRLSH